MNSIRSCFSCCFPSPEQTKVPSHDSSVGETPPHEEEPTLEFSTEATEKDPLTANPKPATYGGTQVENDKPNPSPSIINSSMSTSLADSDLYRSPSGEAVDSEQKYTQTT